MEAVPESESGVVSLAALIAQARERAESFTSRHSQPQDRKEAMLSVDRERRRWTQLYHEKSVAIEQLERELGSTVDALHRSQRSQSADDGGAVVNDSRSTHLDLLNLTDALRKENTTVKTNLETLQEKNIHLEEDLAILKREAVQMRREVEILQRQLTSSSEKWLRQENEYGATISALESEVIELKAERILHKEHHPQVEKRSIPEEAPIPVTHELDTTRQLLTTAREEVAWLREILEYVLLDTLLS